MFYRKSIRLWKECAGPELFFWVCRDTLWSGQWHSGVWNSVRNGLRNVKHTVKVTWQLGEMCWLRPTPSPWPFTHHPASLLGLLSWNRTLFISKLILWSNLLFIIKADDIWLISVNLPFWNIWLILYPSQFDPGLLCIYRIMGKAALANLTYLSARKISFYTLVI